MIGSRAIAIARSESVNKYVELELRAFRDENMNEFIKVRCFEKTYKTPTIETISFSSFQVAAKVVRSKKGDTRLVQSEEFFEIIFSQENFAKLLWLENFL